MILSSRALKSLLILVFGFCSFLSPFLITPTAGHAAMTSPLGEDQHAHIVVHNHTNYRMILTGSNLSWGKWGQSPVDVPSHSHINFDSMGRENSPSGTEGWATWQLEDQPITITVRWDDPYIGSNNFGMESNPPHAVPMSMEPSDPPSGSNVTVHFHVGIELD